MGTTFVTAAPMRRLGSAVAGLVLFAGLLVTMLAVDVPAALAGCGSSGNAVQSAAGSSYSVGTNCSGGTATPAGSRSSGRTAQANLDPNREVCFYRASSGAAPYKVAEPPAGQTAADGKSMDRYCGKASEIAAMRGSSDPLSQCTAPCGATYGLWVKNGAAPTPAQVATSLLAKLDLSAPDKIYTSPDADKHLVVGLPTWLWIERGKDVDSSSDGPITVSARRTLKWSTDQGAVPCNGPGTPYVAGRSDPKAESPDCGFTFRSPGEHTVTVTQTWEITVTGAPGITFPAETRSLSRTVTVDEVQTVN